MPTPAHRSQGLLAGLRLRLPAAWLLAAAGTLFARSSALAPVQDWVFDHYQRLQPRAYAEVPVRVLDIDDEALSHLGQWPWPRTLLAEVVRKLTHLGASAIAFDVVFPEQDRASPERDLAFARAIKASRVVVGCAVNRADNNGSPSPKASFIVQGEDPAPYLEQFTGAVANRPEIERAAAGDGSFSYASEGEGIIRRVPLMVSLRGKLFPSLVAEALRVAQGADSYVVKSLPWGGVDRVKIGRLVVPTDFGGRVLAHFTKTVPERTIPVWRIFEKGFDRRRIANAVVFIGTSAAGLTDQRATPLSPITPGVEVHAQVAEQILLQSFLERPAWAWSAESSFVLVFGALVLLTLGRYGMACGAAVLTASAFAAFAAAWWSYLHRGWLLDPLVPSASVALAYLGAALIGRARSEG